MGKPKRKSLLRDGDRVGKQYDYEKLKKEIFRIIEEENVICVADVYHRVPMDKSTFMRYFPCDSEERKEIDEKIEQKVVSLKANIRDRLLNTNQSIGLIALYKLVGTSEERDALAGSKQTNRNDDEGKNNITLTIS